MFVTALCGTLDLDTGKLVMAKAGHMHPIQKTQDTSAELIVDGALALGLMEDIEYPNVIHNLDPKTSLLMYTDGISEAFNPEREQYEDERLLAFVAQAKDLSADALGSSSLADMEKFVDGAEQSDDITLMVIHYGS